MKESRSTTDRQKKEVVVTRSQFESRQALREQLNKNLSRRSNDEMSTNDFDVSQTDGEIGFKITAEKNESVEEMITDNDKNKSEKKSNLVKASKGATERQRNGKVFTHSQSENRQALRDKNLTQRSDDENSSEDFDVSQIDGGISNNNTAEQNESVKEMKTDIDKNKSTKKPKHISTKNTEYARPDANKITINITVKTLQISRSKANTLAMSQASVTVIVSEVVRNLQFFDESMSSPSIEIPAWFIYDTLCDGLSALHEKLDENTVSGLPGIWDVSQINNCNILTKILQYGLLYSPRSPFLFQVNVAAGIVFSTKVGNSPVLSLTNDKDDLITLSATKYNQGRTHPPIFGAPYNICLGFP